MNLIIEGTNINFINDKVFRNTKHVTSTIEELDSGPQLY